MNAPMRFLPRIPWRWWRRAAQLALLLLFFWLFRRTEYAGADQLAGGENLFFRLDPLAGAAAMIAARQFLAAFWPAAVVVALTLLLGRFFCGWVCPLGTLLDYFHRLIRPITKRTNLANPRRPRAMRYVLLIAVLLAAALAFPLVGLVDPFAILVRGLAFCVDPLFYRGTDAGFAWLGNHAGGVPSFVRGHLLPYGATQFHGASVSAAILATIFALEFVARRFWCRYLCPAGAMMGLLGRRPLVRRTPAKVCPSCGECAAACRMNALDRAEGFQPEACNLCMECVDRCPKGIVRFAVVGKARGSRRPVDLSRRSLLTGVALGVAIPGVATAARLAGPRSVDPHLLRPPGAADEKNFLSLCIRCGECMKVCPTNALQPTTLEAGLEGIFSPRLRPRFHFEPATSEYKDCCEYSCTLCGQVCPTGAIPRLGEMAKHEHPTGKAYFDHSACLPWAQKTPCIRCEEMCPVPDKAIKILKTITIKGPDGQAVEIQQPYIDRDLCIGCGNCESKCTIDGAPGIRVFRPDAPDPGTEFLLKAANK